MISNYEMQEEVQIMCELLLEKFAKKVKVEIPEYSVAFTLSSRSAGCFSRTGSNNLTLNFNSIIMKDNWETFEQTIIHEVAHMCAFIWKGTEYTRSYKRIIHGKTWKDIMRFFGARVERCHNYNTDNVPSVKKNKKTSYAYKCSCQVFNLSSIRHNRALKGKIYYCKKCGTNLERV